VTGPYQKDKWDRYWLKILVEATGKQRAGLRVTITNLVRDLELDWPSAKEKGATGYGKQEV
jgi:hypothetical protein